MTRGCQKICSTLGPIGYSPYSKVFVITEIHTKVSGFRIELNNHITTS